MGQTRNWVISSDSIRGRDYLSDIFSYCKGVVYDVVARNQQEEATLEPRPFFHGGHGINFSDVQIY